MNSKEENKTNSIEEWKRLAEQGIAVEIVTVPKGKSMWPLVIGGRDKVIIRPVKDELKVGDIVLFKRKDGKNVLHRIYKIDSDNKIIQTYGDNCSKPDAPIRPDDVIGVAEEIKKGNLTIKSLRAREVNGAAVGKTLRIINKPIRFAKKVIHYGYDRVRCKTGRSSD